MPFQIWSDAQDPLVVDLTTATYAVAQSPRFFCKRMEYLIRVISEVVKIVCKYLYGSVGIVLLDVNIINS